MKRKKPTLWPKYKLVNHPTLADHHSIQIEDGPFMGAIYTYSNVSIVEGEDCATLKFFFRVEDSAGHGDLDNSPPFKTAISHILGNILEEKEFKIGDDRSQH